MPKSVYAVVYDAAGNVLMPTKVTEYYFMERAHRVWESGQRMPAKKAPGQPAFPGGGQNAGEKPEDGARREFLEETTVSLAGLPSQVYSTTEYDAVYFLTTNLPGMQNDVESNLNLANNVVVPLIRSRTIRSYDDIYKTYPNCPKDNELMVPINVYNLNNAADWNTIVGWNGTQYQNWYYEILLYLKTAILNIPLVRGD